MRERPILFSGPMVQAILEGRKTQTRRTLKSQPEDSFTRHCWFDAPIYGFTDQPSPTDQWWKIKCPYGYIGDRLWVKERWRPSVLTGIGDVVGIEYRADNQWKRFSYDDFGDEWTMPKAAFTGDVTPLFMPRWASRITLEITDVRVERLQDISEEDVEAEGVKLLKTNCDGECGGTPCLISRQPFITLWESINGEGAWDKNPWVWAVSFRRMEVR